MSERPARISPRALARLCGALYLVCAAAGLFSEGYVRATLIVSGDAEATAHNIMMSEQLYRLGGAAQLVAICCDIAVAIILYVLLTPVNRTVSGLAAAFRLMFVAILGASILFHFLPLMLLGSGAYLQSFPHAQLEALALVSARVYGSGFLVANIFFGLHCVLIGGLIFAGRFIPRIIGLALVVAGVGYVINSFLGLAAPKLEGLFFPYILLPGFVAEWSLALWLTIVGLNSARWNRLAGGADLPKLPTSH